jgi:hypothetical protein
VLPVCVLQQAKQALSLTSEEMQSASDGLGRSSHFDDRPKEVVRSES